MTLWRQKCVMTGAHGGLKRPTKKSVAIASASGGVSLAREHAGIIDAPACLRCPDLHPEFHIKLSDGDPSGLLELGLHFSLQLIFAPRAGAGRVLLFRSKRGGLRKHETRTSEKNNGMMRQRTFLATVTKQLCPGFAEFAQLQPWCANKHETDAMGLESRATKLEAWSRVSGQMTSAKGMKLR